MKICDFCGEQIPDTETLHPNVVINQFVEQAPTMIRLDLHQECLDLWQPQARQIKGQRGKKK